MRPGQPDFYYWVSPKKGRARKFWKVNKELKMGRLVLKTLLNLPEELEPKPLFYLI